MGSSWSDLFPQRIKTYFWIKKKKRLFGSLRIAQFEQFTCSTTDSFGSIIGSMSKRLFEWTGLVWLSINSRTNQSYPVFKSLVFFELYFIFMLYLFPFSSLTSKCQKICAQHFQNFELEAKIFCTQFGYRILIHFAFDIDGMCK